jgi:hypothetical protein
LKYGCAKGSREGNVLLFLQLQCYAASKAMPDDSFLFGLILFSSFVVRLYIYIFIFLRCLFLA